MFSVAPNILLAPNMTQNAERKHRTQDANTAHNRLRYVTFVSAIFTDPFNCFENVCIRFCEVSFYRAPSHCRGFYCSCNQIQMPNSRSLANKRSHVICLEPDDFEYGCPLGSLVTLSVRGKRRYPLRFLFLIMKKWLWTVMIPMMGTKQDYYV